MDNNKLWEFILELYNADKVAFVTLVLSLITGPIAFITNVINFFVSRKRQKEDDIR